MGLSSAMDMRDQDISLEAQISWHLQSNHYPPIHESMIPTCIEAIDLANCGMWNVNVSLPEGVGYRGLTVAPVWAIIEQHHLEPWLEEDE